MTDATRILVCSGDQASRGRLVELFRRADFDVTPFTSGAGLLESVARQLPELVIVDFRLLDMLGYELCHQLRERFGESMAIILLSENRSESHDRVAGLLIGADEYVPKPFDPSELVTQARRLLARTSNSNEDGPASTLTPRELDVLRLLARGLSSEKIAEELFISRRTVETHVQRILTKLGVHSRIEAVALAYRDGVVDPHQIS